MSSTSALASVEGQDHIARVTGYANLAGFGGSTGKLAEALALAQLEFKPVNKSKTAKVRGEKNGRSYEYEYKYADLADILGMCIPILAKHGIALTQPLIRRENKLYVVTRIQFKEERDEDGGIAVPEAIKPQEMGGYLTYYRRYGVSSYLGIATEEDLDGPPSESQASHKSSTSEQPAKKPIPTAKEFKPSGTVSAPVHQDPAPQNTFVASESDVPANISSKPTPEQKKEYLARLRVHIGVAGEARVKEVGNIVSTTTLTVREWDEALEKLDTAAKEGKLKEPANV